MKITLSSETKEDLQMVLNWATMLIDTGAECTVYVGGPGERPPLDPGAPSKKKPLLDAARDVIAGVHGIGQDRIDSLRRAGYNQQERVEIQQIVNRIMKG